MKLERLSLTNCGGFEQIDIRFEPDVTLIAGVNGVGKSTVLHLLAVLLSKSNRRLQLTRELPLHFSKDHVFLGTANASAKLSFDISGRKLSADLSAELSRKSFETFDLFGLTEEASHQNMLSVLYSPKRQLPGQPKKLPNTKPFSPAVAYERALHDREVDLREFMHWFRVQQVLGVEESHRLRVLEALQRVVSELMPEFTNLRIQEAPRLGFLVDKRGGSLYLHQLSDGERGLLAVVFDLTRRLAIANPGSSDPIAEGTAVVLIDEIELHLHPKWQRQILQKLQSIFKSCQFIVTTHSPQVIGQVKAEKLRLLDIDGTGKVVLQPTTQAFGMDSSWVLQNVMSTPARDHATEQRLSALYSEIDNGNYDTARRMADEIRSEIGEFPDLQEASALLDRLKMLEEA